MENEEFARKLAVSYSSFVKVDNQSHMEKLEESIEETLTRLEELESGIKMLQAERERVRVCDLTAAQSGLSTLCQKVHKLDELSQRVLRDVEALEPVVDQAEVSLASSAEGRLKTMLKPLFFKSESPMSTQSQTPPFTPISHFKTGSIFPKEEVEHSST
ncbi:uncharacterized protein LOC128983195 isoform X2 [Macrosteles quadrilineatus]|uniref:uncharacterized protein LOC128983195 isoform X2 n=1 Tax=Macrosteles quadrilineatus TaxID=74068 RepID=UPI0023E0DC32|nr:uncharacterized protein LOC128983195 isoform X2 [Macrosteles quadrilineatus]